MAKNNIYCPNCKQDTPDVFIDGLRTAVIICFYCRELKA